MRLPGGEESRPVPKRFAHRQQRALLVEGREAPRRVGWGRLGMAGDGWGWLGTAGDGWGRLGTRGTRPQVP